MCFLFWPAEVFILPLGLSGDVDGEREKRLKDSAGEARGRSRDEARFLWEASLGKRVCGSGSDGQRRRVGGRKHVIWLGRLQGFRRVWLRAVLEPVAG